MYRTNVATLLIATLFSLFAAGGCASQDELDIGEGDLQKQGIGKADTSAEAVFVDMKFSGHVLVSSTFNPKKQIEDQLLYTIGHLNGDRAVGRLDQLSLENVHTQRVDGLTKITYDATLPVAWGNKSRVPSTYEFVLPKNGTFSGYEDFTSKYSHDCVDFGAHDVTSGSMWYYYRPNRCDIIDDADVVVTTAEVSLSEINTTGKFPEYHKVWEDDVLRVVAVFGKYEDNATTGDAGIDAYNRFLRAMKDELSRHGVTTVPESVPFAPGVDMPEVTFSADIGDGRSIEVVALLVDNVRTAGSAFNARYEELSTNADMIAYNGHAGLGANIRALARKGRWIQGQYVVMFINGCDTYAYVDSALADAHKAVNSDDTTGHKYMDIVTNALPSFFRSMSAATLALVRGLLDYDNPKTYEQIFARIDRAQVVLVSGEQDNEFVPGFGDDHGDVVTDWSGLSKAGSVREDEEQRWTTPTLAAGTYEFTLTGTRDADLYVRVGNEPTKEQFDCRPFKSGSNESCVVTLPSAAVIHVMVRGWAANSDFELEAARN